MHSLIELYKQGDTLHHAYFVVSHKAHETAEKVKDFFKSIVGIETAGNPDFWFGKFDTLTIDDARLITDSESRKNFGGDKKVFVIQANFITEEAQNAFLKVFEEPTPGTHFFIISPQDMLLPTLRSRMQVISENFADESSPSVLKLDMASRMSLVKEITEAISDEEKTKQDAIAFLNQIEAELYKNGVEKSRKSLEACQHARAFLYDRGAPIKMILENLVLSI